MDALKTAGIAGKRIRISAKNQTLEAVILLDGKSVGENGFHDFIDVNGKIYDNNVSGVSKDEYFRRLEASTPLKSTVEEF